MFSVVAVHILTFGVGIKPTTSALCVLRGAFTLPLFFMVSGYFLYRPVSEWSRSRILRSLRVRFIAMVVGTFLVITIFTALLMPRQDPFFWIHTGYPDRYWFTYTLFQIFIYYLAGVGLSKLCRCPLLIPLFVLSILADGIFCVWQPEGIPRGFWANWACNKHTVVYMQFAVAGMLIRKYEPGFFRILMRPATLTAILVIFISACALYVNRESGRIDAGYALSVKICYELGARYCGALIVINIFYYNKDYFNGNGRFVRYWRKVGTRTLDIYFLHYFFLPKMYWIRPYISQGNTFLPELVLAFTGAAIIVVLCVAFSDLLRRAPFIRNLLGAK